MGKAERKYGERHAEPEAKLAASLGEFGHALVIPAYGEGEELERALASVPAGPLGRVLVVLVVNGKPSAPDWVHEENRSVLPRLRRAVGGGEVELSAHPPAHLFSAPIGQVLCVDRSAPEHAFPDDQGVGLARKIGADIAFSLWMTGRLRSPFLHSTDADAELPPDYFARIDAATGAAAVVYPFSHRPERDPDLARAVLLYEVSLRYYVLGLRYAGSPYAHHTIGSTIAARADAYAMVRGFPRRDAAEDFYLLAKLAKVGRVEALSGRPIVLGGRASSRVPFGTGAAVRRIAAAGAQPFRMYDPILFRYLRAWLQGIEQVASTSGSQLDAAIEQACQAGALEPRPLVAAAHELGAHAALASARERSFDAATLGRHLHTWFDAFRTLKLVHLLQRSGIEPNPWQKVLADAPFTCGALSCASEEDLSLVCGRLAALERLV